MIPQVNYIKNENGQPIFVQMKVSEWEKLMDDYKKLKAERKFKKRFKSIFNEIHQIQKGEKQGTSLSEFLNEL